MGKRELLLIGGFILVGVMVYYATAPAAAPGQKGFSLAALMDHLRREVHGNRADVEVKSSTTVPLKPGVTEVRFESGTASIAAAITIVGEDREDVVCDLAVRSTGYDEAEARRYATETTLTLSDAGSSLGIGISYPIPREQRANLHVRLPKRLAVRIQPSRGKLDISHVASAELVEARGHVNIRGVSGRVVINHRGGALTIDNASALKLNTRGSTVVVKDVKGDTTLQLQAGELRGSGLVGPVEIESSNTKVVLDDLKSTRRPIRINAVGGSVSLAGPLSDTRIDGRDTRIDVTFDEPAPVAIYNEADEPIEVTLPHGGGYQFDALAKNGRLTLPDSLQAYKGLELKSSENEQRVRGAIDGGGPTITLRASHGNIVVRSPRPQR
jgi:hypothetical protein